ncbi:MAG: sensor histidine kinase, partial [Clostridia bacterium]|nr:sensor histidine kinase [Clostridia bacterium]
MLKRLRIQLVCAIMGVSALILVVVFALILRFTQRNLENQSLMAMQSIAVNTREPGRPGNREEELLLPYFILEETRDGGIRVLGGSDFDLEDESLRATLMEKATGSKSTSGLLPEYDLRYLRSYSPTGARVVFVDISMERSAVTTLIRTCLLIGTAALILLFLLSILLSRWFIRPVEKAWTLQKQFVADASHELKTPLTVILTNVELLQSPVCNENDRARFSQNILVMSRRMRG